MKNHSYVQFICVFLLLLVSQGSESRNLEENGVAKSKNGERNRGSACSAMGSRCLCRRPRQKEQSLTCTKQDCMERLPTDEIPDEQVKEVVSLLVKRQHNLTRIGSNELRRLGNIRHIRIIRCRIREVEPNAFIGLNYVERLDLHRNNLSDVPSAIRFLRNVRSLNLGGNQISFIKNGAFFANIHLERLILGRNYITRMPTLLPKTLVKLSISYNNLEALDGIVKLTNLRTLNAVGNKLHKLPDLPKSLQAVSLCSNRINHTISVAGLPNLRIVNLNHNPSIGPISLSTFYHVDSRSSAFELVTFEARNSGVTDVDSDAFSCLPRLENVDLAENSITDYHELWFAGNRRLRSISLSENNFKCDCDVTSSLKEIASKFIKRRNRKGASGGLNGSFINDFDRINCSNQVLQPCRNFEFRTDYCFRTAPTTTKTTTTTAKPTTSVEPSTDSTTTRGTVPTTTSTTESTTSVRTTTTRPTITSASTLTTSTTTTSTSTTTPITTTTTTTPVTTTDARAASETESAEPETTGMNPDVSSDSSLQSTKMFSGAGEILIPSIQSVSGDIATSTLLATTEQVKEEWCLKSGEKCHFPFTYNGEEYTECAPSFSGSWCSRTPNYESGTWDYCKIC